MRRFLRENGLSLTFLTIFVLSLIGQSVAGWFDENERLAEHGQAAVSYGHFVTSSSFLVDVAENWQSEFLQFFLFIFATVWLIQRGSPESKKPGHGGPGTRRQQRMGPFARADSPRWSAVGGVREWAYANSLLIVMGAVFLLSWFAQSLGGMVALNEENAQHGQAALTWLEYIVAPDFWNRTLQNWQSEFLAVGSMVTLSIYLRQQGSSQSKPVGASHAATAEESP
jgi:hypothetical protein